MSHLFRRQHTLNILKGYEIQSLPLDLFLSHYFRSHKALGAKDRAAIVQTIYAMMRWRSLLDFLCSSPPTWEERLDQFSSWDLQALLKREDIPIHIRVSFPKVLFDLLVSSHGIEKACELCRISNEPAPTALRINTMKTTREAMLAQWEDHYSVKACQYSSAGVMFERRVNFFEMPEFKQGLFEVQDEGSQLVAQLVNAQPGQLVMDYCAGAGGKTLAFAPQMQNTGQIFLHDIRKYALQQGRKRLRRAGIQNAQMIHDGEENKLKKLKKRMDWVLVDVPCTGTGTIRRNPDMKWKFDCSLLERLIGQQRVIFEKALSFLKPGGRIIYATCSMIKEENRLQLAHFMQVYHLKLDADIFEALPIRGGMDGFFGAVLKHN